MVPQMSGFMGPDGGCGGARGGAGTVAGPGKISVPPSRNTTPSNSTYRGAIAPWERVPRSQNRSYSNFEIAPRLPAQEVGDATFEMGEIASCADDTLSVSLLEPNGASACIFLRIVRLVAKNVVEAPQGDRCAGLKGQLLRRPRKSGRDPGRVVLREFLRLPEAGASRHRQYDVTRGDANAEG